jgi:hypothetical protein
MKRSPKNNRSAASHANLPDSLPDRRVSWFKSATSKTPYKTATLAETFRQIESKRLPLQDRIRALQEKWAAAVKAHGPDSPEAKAIYKEKQRLKEKSWLPAFSLSALFDGKRANQNVSEHSGALQIDIDHLESGAEWNRVCKALQESSHIWKIWRSISGDGIKAAFLVPPSIEHHRDAFRAAAEHVHKLTGREIDEACKDPARICFFSHSKVWTNEEACPIDVVTTALASGNGSTAPAPITDLDPLKQKLREIAESVLGPIGKWQQDDRGRWFAYCRCPDTSREHYNEARPNTRVYLNPNSVPRIECRHGECAPVVKKRQEVLKREWLAQKNVIVLPAIQTLDDYIDKEIILPADVIKGVAHLGGKIVLGGGAKSFKTWQQLDVCVSVASGSEWLGFPTRRGRVLYLNFELPAAFCWKRIQDICRKKGVRPAADHVHVWNLRGYATDIDTLMPVMLARIQEIEQKEIRYALIVLDPIYKVLGRMREENAAGDIATLLNELERLAVQSGAAVLFGAHYSKGNQAAKESIDRISGSGVFGRDPDTILNFTKHEQEDAYVVETILRNHPPIEPFTVRWQFPLMVLAPELDPTLFKEPGKRGPGAPAKGSRIETLCVLENAEKPLTTGQWWEKRRKRKDLPKISKTTFEGHLRQLRNEKEISKYEDGTWYVAF